MDAIKILGSLLSSGALSGGSASNVLGNVLGSVLSGGGQQSGGMMGNVLGSLLGGGASQQGRQGGGMGDVLGSLLGGAQGGNQGGGMGNVLGSLLGGASQQGRQGGGMGDVLGSLLGGAQGGNQGGGMGNVLGSLLGGGASQQGGQGGGLADLLGGAVSKYMQTQNPAVPDLSSQLPDQQAANAQATLIVRAMINAAKADGSVDQQEQDKIIAKLGNISDEEANFIRAEFQAPLDVAAFVRSVPRGMEQQVYALSLAAIDLDTKTEAQYLHQLAQGLNLDAQACNQLHDQVGAPKLYS